MHLEGAWLSSTSTRKRAEKITKAQREELERNWRDRNKRLKGMGLPKQTFEEFLDFVHGRKTEKKTGPKDSIRQWTPSLAKARSKAAEAIKPSIPDLSYRTQHKIIKTPSATASATPLEDQELVVNSVPLEITRPKLWVTGPTSSKQTPAYTGTNIVGIGTMHKSNMVPIFSDQEAQDISKMRR
jgi:hypothetical protein